MGLNTASEMYQYCKKMDLVADGMRIGVISISELSSIRLWVVKRF